MSHPIMPPREDNVFRILALDGGGSMGFYSLGVLKEIEAMVNCPLHKTFDLVFGTSTGAIIAALIALGNSVDDIHALYLQHVPTVMSHNTAKARSRALQTLASEVFAGARFEDAHTGIGIVAASWLTAKPMIFKNAAAQSHGREATFIPGFGVSIADAVRASCSATPFFERTTVTTSQGERIELVDGGYCANNPSLYAIADAVESLRCDRTDIRLINVGVGTYPAAKQHLLMRLYTRFSPCAYLLQKTLEINTQSMEQLCRILFPDVPMLRISNPYVAPEMATSLLECDLKKLGLLFRRGRESFAEHEKRLREYLA